MKPSEWAQEIVDEWDGLSTKEVEDTLSADGVTTWWNYDLARAYLRLREEVEWALVDTQEEETQFKLIHALEEANEMD